jgi:sugar lactone lactonase YvrE
LTEDANFQPVARGFYLEALLVDGDDVWFGDVVTGGIRKLGTETLLLPERQMIGGLLANDDGKLLVAGISGIVWVDPESGESGTLLGGLDGVNEMRVDGKGGIWFGSIDLPGILRGEKPGSSSLYRLSKDRELTLAYEGLAFANGLSCNADGTQLYFNESFVGPCAWDIEADDTLGPQRRLAEKYDCDGMALDAAGNIWISGFSSPELLCLSPDGDEIARLPLPGEACTNVRFGGADMQEIYVTMVTHAGAKALTEGRMPDALDSVLYKGQSPVVGAPISRAGFTF